MKSPNPKKSIANMDVLDDIRGLLSTGQGRSPQRNREKTKNPAPDALINSLRDEIKEYQEQLKTREGEITRLKKELEELAVKLECALKAKDSKPAASPQPQTVPDAAVQLEARITELTQTMEQIEDLLKLKSQELLKKIARVFQEGGQDEAGLEFRRGASQLEAAENFARFLRLLIG